MWLHTRLFSIQKYLFYLLLLFLPTQFGKHFWPEFSYIQGIRSDYLSPTIYVTDVLVLSLFLLQIVIWIKVLVTKHQISNIKYQKSQPEADRPLDENIKYQILKYWKLVVLVVFLIVGILLSSSPLAGVYGLIKLLEMVFFGFFVSSYLSKTKDLKKELFIISLLFSVSILFESFLAIFQFIKQGSVGGLLYFFGERTFIGSTPGIANVSINGELILRPYGTLSHPNVLAGFLLLVMTFLLFVFQHIEKKNIQILVLLALAFGTVALILSFSRITILLWIAVVLFHLFNSRTPSLSESVKRRTSRRVLNLSLRQAQTKIWPTFVILVFIVLLFFFSPLPQRFFETRFDEEAITTRIELTQASLKMIADYPLFGVGLNNFLIKIPEYFENTTTGVFQPVHNIYLLIAAQFGLIIFIIIIMIIIKTISQLYQKMRSTHNPFDAAVFMSLIMVLTLGLFDHYLLTLQQGQLLLSIFLGLSFVKMKNKMV